MVKKLPRILWVPKVHYSVYESQALVPLSVTTILILSSHPSLGLFLSRLPIIILYAFFIFPMHATCTAHLILLSFLTPVILGEDYKLHYAI